MSRSKPPVVHERKVNPKQLRAALPGHPLCVAPEDREVSSPTPWDRHRVLDVIEERMRGGARTIAEACADYYEDPETGELWPMPQAGTVRNWLFDDVEITQRLYRARAAVAVNMIDELQTELSDSSQDHIVDAQGRLHQNTARTQRLALLMKHNHFLTSKLVPGFSDAVELRHTGSVEHRDGKRTLKDIFGDGLPSSIERFRGDDIDGEVDDDDD